MSPASNNTSPLNGDLTEERRRFIRLNINADIKFSVVPQNSPEYISKTKDIGAGGICLLTDSVLKTGDVLKLEIFLPEDPPSVQATGKVVWVKPFSIANENKTRFDAGVEFTSIAEPDRKKINKYVFSLKIK